MFKNLVIKKYFYPNTTIIPSHTQLTEGRDAVVPFIYTVHYTVLQLGCQHSGLNASGVKQARARSPSLHSYLLPVQNVLLENAKLIANAIACGWNLERGQRFQKASRQSPQPPIAQSRLFFDVENLVDVGNAETPQCFGGLLLDAQHQKVVAKLGTDQEFGG